MRWIELVPQMGEQSALAREAARLGAAALLAVCALAALPGQAHSSPLFLDAAQMDGVTAAKIQMDIELSATAQGPTVMTSTQGTVSIGQTTGVRVAYDPSAPPEARVRLIDQETLQVGIAVGKAQATGANSANCNATPTISGADYTKIAQTQTFTAISATCSCTALAVGFLTH
jgi:hypothetical protein